MMLEQADRARFARSWVSRSILMDRAGMVKGFARKKGPHMELLSASKAFGGSQRVYRHDSAACACPMTFAIYLPHQIEDGPVPVLWYLSGLTCTHQNAMDKGEYRAAAAANGIAIICPDTSP